MNTFTATAWIRAYALASAFGHWWATSEDLELALLMIRPTTAKEMADTLVAKTPEEEKKWIGLTPREEDGYLAHESAQGGVSWTVSPEGVTTVYINRPAPGRAVGSSAGVVVLSLRLEVDRDTTITSGVSVVPALCRHWEMFEKCADALDVGDDVRAVMPPLVARTLKKRKELMSACSDTSSMEHDANCQRAGEIERAADEQIVRVSRPLPRNARQRAAMGEI